MPLHDGTSGSVSIKVGAAAAITVTKIEEWEAESETEIKEKGPYIGDPAKSKIRAGIGVKGSLSGVVPVGRDAGQTALLNAQLNGTDVKLTLVQTNGYTLDIPVGIISKVKIGQKADDGVPVSFDFEDNGGFTLIPTV